MNSKTLPRWLVLSMFLLTTPLLSTETETDSIELCWSGKIKMGLTLDWGNTECSDYCGGLCLNRQTKLEDCLLHEYFFSGDFRYKKKNQTISENRGSIKAVYRSYFDDRRSLQFSERLKYDTIKSLHIGSQTILSFGYKFFNSKDFCLMSTAGAGYSYRKFSDKIESSPTANFSLDGKKQIKEHLVFSNLFEIIIPCDAIDKLSCLDIMSLCYELSSNWSLELCHKWDYFNSPSEGKKRQDQKLDCCLVYRICP